MVTPDLLDKFSEINKALDRCCELALKQPLPNKQIALMTDASFTAAGYAVLIEDDPLEKFTSTRKVYAPVAYGSKTFSPAQLKKSIYAKEFLAIFFAFEEFGHIFWGTQKPVIILTDNKSVTRFFQTKIIPPSLWNACDYIIQFNFTIAHTPGKNNTAADYLSLRDNSSKIKVTTGLFEQMRNVTTRYSAIIFTRFSSQLLKCLLLLALLVMKVYFRFQFTSMVQLGSELQAIEENSDAQGKATFISRSRMAAGSFSSGRALGNTIRFASLRRYRHSCLKE